SDVILRSVADGKETKFSGGGGFGQMLFALNSKWFGFTYTPYTKAGAAGATPPGPGAGSRPRAKLVLVNLANGEENEIEGAGAFRFSGEAATHIVYRKVSEAPAVPTGAPGPGPGAPPAAPSAGGSDLVLRELGTGTDFVLGNVADFEFDKKGNWLVTVID